MTAAKRRAAKPKREPRKRENALLAFTWARIIRSEIERADNLALAADGPVTPTAENMDAKSMQKVFTAAYELARMVEQHVLDLRRVPQPRSKKQ